MNILDYLTGNTDRHPENWGFYVDNSNNKYTELLLETQTSHLNKCLCTLKIQ